VIVKLKLYAYFRDLFGGREQEAALVPGSSGRDLLNLICDSSERREGIFSGQDLKPHIVVMINGSPLPSATGLDTPLRDGDVVSLFPFMGGG
jgi:MoaD family protein